MTRPLPVLLICVALLAATSTDEAAEHATLSYEPYVIADGEGISNGRVGNVKAIGPSTQGNYSVVVRGPYTTQGPEAHTHSHLYEAWYILDGALKFQSRDRVFDAPAGTFVFIPPGVDHRFWTEPGVQVKVVQILAPPGLEKFFDERIALPNYDPNKSQAEQSAAWKRDSEAIARKYGAGPAETTLPDPPIIVAPGSTTLRSLATFSMTGGRYSLDEVTRAPTRVKAATTSQFDEAWLVIAGQLSFEIEIATGKRHPRIVKVGDFVFVPRGTVFSLSRTGSQRIRLLHWKSNELKRGTR
jgi:mannose-6-phosphate isomerase-like protein (cupin superfamily)